MDIWTTLLQLSASLAIASYLISFHPRLPNRYAKVPDWVLIPATALSFVFFAGKLLFGS